MQISGMSLTLTWPLRLCLLRVLLGATTTATTFPFPSSLGEVTLHPLSQASMFIYSSHGRWVFTLSCGVFLPPPLLQAFLLLIAGCVPPLLPSPASLFVYSSGKESPPPLFGTQATHPLCYVSLLFLLLITQFLFFSPEWGSVCPRGCADLAQGCLWEYCVPLSSPCSLHLPKPSGRWHLAGARWPSWFLCLTWSGDAMLRLEVWKGQRFASSRWFFL
jgi:hypothetical protein